MTPLMGLQEDPYLVRALLAHSRPPSAILKGFLCPGALAVSCSRCSSTTWMSGWGASAREGSSPPQGRGMGSVCARVVYRDPDGNEIGFGGGPLE